VGHFPGYIGRPRSMAAKMAQNIPNCFVRETRSPKCHFSAADFHQIWIQHVNWCGHQSFRKTVANFSENGSLTPKTDFWRVFQWVSCPQPGDKLASFWVKMTIPCYSPRAKDVPFSGDFLYSTIYSFGDTLRWKYQNFLKIQLGYVYSFALRDHGLYTVLHSQLVVVDPVTLRYGYLWASSHGSGICRCKSVNGFAELLWIVFLLKILHTLRVTATFLVVVCTCFVWWNMPVYMSGGLLLIFVCEKYLAMSWAPDTRAVVCAALVIVKETIGVQLLYEYDKLVFIVI